MSLPATAKAARTLADNWLAHLKRDPRGFPVPWINRWGADGAASTRIAWDHHVNRRGVFHDDYGPTPDFTAQNIGRQRHAIVAGLCQVCGRAIPWSRRNLVLSGVSTETVDLGGEPVVAVIEPWLDDRCAAIATLLCPALIRRGRDDDLHVLPVRRAKDVQIIVSVGTLDAGMLAAGEAAHPDHVAQLRAAANRPVAMWAKILLLNHRIIRGERPPAVPAGGYATVAPYAR